MASFAPKATVLRITGSAEGKEIILEAGSAQELQDGSLTLITKPRPLYEGPFTDLYRGNWTRPDGVIVDVVVKTFRHYPIVIEKVSIDLRPPVAHPNIQEILAYGQCSFKDYSGWDKTGFVLVYPFCMKINLYQLIARGPKLSLIDKLELVTKTARGIEYMHVRNPPIVHGNLKPGHILIDDDGSPRIVDFGLFDIGSICKGNHTLTGESEYQPAPFENRDTLAGDVYSFAKVVLFVLTEERPWRFTEMAKLGETNARERETGIKRSDYHDRLNDDTLWDLLEKWGCMRLEERPTMTEVLREASAFPEMLPFQRAHGVLVQLENELHSRRT